jgi:multiple sugar transport system substrate-binding protein
VKRIPAVALLAALVWVAGHGCGRGAPEQAWHATITVLVPEHHVTQAMRAEADAFMGATGIRVQIEALAEDLYFDRMEMALRAPRGVADVYMLPMDSTAYTQWTNGLIAPVTPYLADPARTPADYDLADFPMAFLEPAQYPPGDPDAQLYGIPVSFEAYILFYNKGIVDRFLDGEVPQTMDDLLAAAQRVTQSSGGSVAGAVMRGIRSDTITDTVTGMVLNRWGDAPAPLPYNVWFDGAWDAPRVTDPRIAAGLADYAGMMKAGPPNIQAMDWPEASLLFSQGRAAFYIDASLFGPGFEDPATSLVADHVGYAPLPPAADGPSRTGHWVWGLAIPANAQQPEAAWEFIRWFTSKEVAPAVGAYHGGAPRLSTWDDPEYRTRLNTDYVETVQNVMTTSRSTVVFRGGWKGFAIEIAEAVQKIYSGTPPDTATENLHQRFRALLAR